MSAVASDDGFTPPQVSTSSSKYDSYIDGKGVPRAPQSPSTPVSYDDVVRGSGPLGFAPVPTSGNPEPRRLLKDPQYLLLYIAHIIVLIVLGSYRSSKDFETGWFSEPSVADSLVTKLTVSAVVAAVFGVGWTWVVFSRLRSRILYVSQTVAGVLLFVHAIILFVTDQVLLAVTVLCIIIGDSLWMVHARSRFKFVEVLLDVVIQLLQRRRVLIVIVGAAVVVQCVYLAMWARLLEVVLRTSEGKTPGDIFILILLFFSLRWTCGMIKHVVTVTISGTFAALLQLSSKPVETSFTYDVDEDLGLEFGSEDLPHTGFPPGFSSSAAGAASDHSGSAVVPRVVGHGNGLTSSDDADDELRAALPRKPAVAAAAAPGGAASADPFVSFKNCKPQDFLCQALTTNLGSICAGAAVGFMSPLLWALLRALRRCERAKTKSVHRAAVRMTKFVDGALRGSHKYAYTQVATKGKSWFVAAKDTWRSFMHRGVEGVVYDDCTDRLMLFGCYAGAALLTLAMGISIQAGTHNWVLIAVVVFWFGFVGVGLPLTVLEASISTLFVSFAEIPDSLSHCHPIVYLRFARISELRYFRRTHGDDQRDEV